MPEARITFLLAAWVALAAFAGANRAHAQPRIEDTLPSSDIDLGDDPIGVSAEDRSLGTLAAEREATDRAAAERDRLRFGPRAPTSAVRTGEVLTAQGGAREATHRTSLWLEHGMVRVQVELQLESSAERPTELGYRLATPADASVASLEVCNAMGCRHAVPDRAAGPFSAYDDAVQSRSLSSGATLPVAHAREVDDPRGHALWLRAAPLDKSHPLTLRVSYVAPLRAFGGHARVSFPARGMDPQVAPAEVVLRSSDLSDVRLNGLAPGSAPLMVDPWSGFELSARVPSSAPPRVELWRSRRCGTAGCARLRAYSGPRPTQPVDLVLAIDVSPSTAGPSRGRLPAVLVGLLGALPEGSRVRALSFAARARDLITQSMDAAALPLEAFASVFDQRDLGSATRFEAAWASIAAAWSPGGRAPLKRQVVIIGDGGLTRGPARPFAQAKRAGVVVHALNLDERAARPALSEGVASTGGELLELGAALVAEERGLEPSHLEARLAALFAAKLVPSVRLRVDGRTFELGALHAGEELVWEGAVKKSIRVLSPASSVTRPAPATLRDALALRGTHTRSAGLVAVDSRDLAQAGAGRPTPGSGDPRGPATRHSGVSSDQAPVALAAPRTHTVTGTKPAAASGVAGASGKGMPDSPLLTMLRRRVLPVARGCFRRDRAGRLDYELRAVFEFELAEQEVVAAQVTGKLPEDLRSCLLAAVDTLEVPRFSGSVVVRYPLRTQAETLPEQIELSPTTAQNVDRLLAPGDGS